MNLVFVLIFGYVFLRHFEIEMNPLRITAVVVTMAGIFIGALYKYQGKLLYQNSFPPGYKKPSDNPSPYQHPGQIGFNYENVYLQTPDGLRLHAWFIHARNSDGTAAQSRKFPTLLFYHANAGNMGFRMPDLRRLLENLDMNVFILSYRGYGESEGEPDEDGLMVDAEAAYQHVINRPEVDPAKLFVYGRSLGGAVAVYIASRHDKELKGVILENTFTSISDIVDSVFPILAHIKEWVLTIGWKSIDRIETVTCPLLFMSGQQDELVPKSHMDALYEAATSTSHKEIHRVEDGMHNDTLQKGGAAYMQKFLEFMTRALESGESGESWEEEEQVEGAPGGATVEVLQTGEAVEGSQ